MATTINLNAPLLDPDGNAVLDGTTLGKLLSNEIFGASINEEPMKFFDWALDLRKTGVIVVDNTDKEKLVTLITRSSSLTTLGKGRILEAIKASDQIRPVLNYPGVDPAANPVADAQQVSDLNQEAT